MADNEAGRMPPGGPVSGCGVPEERFPYIGECYLRSISNLGITCGSKCVHCRIWTSLPDGASLTVTRIFGCDLYGYDKRIKDERD